MFFLFQKKESETIVAEHILLTVSMLIKALYEF